MKKKCFWGKILRDILDIYIPSILFLMMFFAFLLGIYFRYIMRAPQSWTFELESICFLSVCIFSVGIAHRTEEDIVFDMLYLRAGKKAQCMMRILSHAMVMTFSVLMFPASVRYLLSMKGLVTQIIGIPRILVFLCFPVMFASSSIRSAYRMTLDIKAFRAKTYEKNYPAREEGTV